MRKIDSPTIDDNDVLDNLLKSSGKHAKSIVAKKPTMKTRYDLYSLHNGNPWDVPKVRDFALNSNNLKHLYNSPPKALSFISELRSSIKGSCPVCGRDALGTLDHYLPKNDFPEFSFLSKNLVPSCDRCNNLKNDSYKGTVASERPIHPYFDALAQNRILSIDIQPDWRAPLIKPIAYGLTGSDLILVNWHIKNIIVPAGIVDYYSGLWGTIIDEPETYLKHDPTPAAVSSELLSLERIETAAGRSPNGWRASFYHGIRQNPDAVNYLASLLV